MRKLYDAIIIGSGFGGSMTAYQLVNAGLKVLMIERGDWVKRSPDNWGVKGSLDLTPFYDKSSQIQVLAGGNKKEMGTYACVGGPSIFYGGVSFRFRENDFAPPSDITQTSKAEWPYKYADLEKYYTKAERILNIAGESGVDPTEPFRSEDFPQKRAPLADISKKIKRSAESLGLHPFGLPLAINYEDKQRATCQNCTTCDTFACAISAKNDLATILLPQLQQKGLDILPNTVVTQLKVVNKKIESVSCIDRGSGEKKSFSAPIIVLSAGAMASPHLLLASGLEKLNPGGQNIGRYLMRHVNNIVFGIFPGTADKEKRFHKQLAILDYYNGHHNIEYPKHKLGSLQQMPTPPEGLVQNEIPGVFGKWLSKGVRLLTGLLAIAEDQPQFSNYIAINKAIKDQYGLPQRQVSHHYSKRDLAAVKSLSNQAKKIMLKSGALTHYVHPIKTFSHAVGTVRMGIDPKHSVLDEYCQFRGLDNLYVIDGSFMPTSAAVNPSLTISANALRAAEQLVLSL